MHTRSVQGRGEKGRDTKLLSKKVVFDLQIELLNSLL